MVRVMKLENYSDEQGNTIAYTGTRDPKVKIKFTGSNNRLVVADTAYLENLVIDFDCDNGVVEIGGNTGVASFIGAIRVGQDSRVFIGQNVTSTTSCHMSACEGTTITIGDDVMFASENQLRADDGHAIFDVRSGKRVNVSRSITIGNHVWLARGAVVLGGATIGDGTVVGYGSIVTKPLPNNCVAAGVPARVLRRDVAWERPHLSLAKPYYKPDASTVKKSPYWHLTTGDEQGDKQAPPITAARVGQALRWRARRVANRVQARRNT